MKKTAIFGAILLLAGGLATAAEFTTSGLPAGQSGTFQGELAPVDITQSTDLTVLSGYGVSCNAGGLAAENNFLRRFFLAADHGIFNQYDVLSVDIGVESTTVLEGTLTCEARIYSIADGAPFTFANMALNNVGPFVLTEADDLVVVNVPSGGSFPDPVAANLVLDFWVPDGQTSPNVWGVYPGANNLGQSRPSYLAAADCGVTEPTDAAGLGFPDMHYVMVVRGDEVPVELQTFTID